MLKILGRVTSINVRKVMWCADELGLDYAHEPWGNPPLSLKSPEFVALNPNAQVPVIVEDGFVMHESNAIMRYLAESRTQFALVPSHRQERALMEQWLGWQATELNPTWGYAVQALIRKAPGYDDRARIEKSLVAWTAKMALLEERLRETGAFVAGANFTLADIALGLSAHRFYAAQPDMDVAGMPSVRAWYEGLKHRKAAVAYLSAATP